MEIHFRHRPHRNGGFSLAATLLMMVLLTMLALGLLTLSATQLRASGRGAAQAEARANARLALMEAIGQLQRSLGPDGRVSAPMTLFDRDPATPGIEGVAQPNWLGVWQAAMPDGNGIQRTPLGRDDADGGLRDARSDGAWNREAVLACLVSGANPDLDARTAEASPDWIRLVGPGSTNRTDDEIRVPAVRVKGDGRTALEGRYAWWIGDEGQKARVDTVDAFASAKPIPAEAAKGGYNHWLASQTATPAVIDKQLALDEETKTRTVSVASTTLTFGATAAKEHFHDFTTSSLGLPVNVPGARLKRDLTAYLAANGSVPGLKAGGDELVPGLADDDRMVGPANSNDALRKGIDWASTRHQRSSPRFGLLRRWARFTDSYGLTQADTPMVPVRVQSSPHLSGDDSFDGTNRKPAASWEYDTPDLSPVLVEGSIYYNLTAEPASNPAQFQLRIHLYPRVAIWNPYNIALQVPATMLMLHVNGAKVAELRLADTTRVQQRLTFGDSGALGGALYFGLEPVTLEPGATAVFSPAARSVYSSGQAGANRLSASVTPSPDRSFTVAVGAALSAQPLEFTETGSGLQAQDYRMLWKLGGNGATSPAQFKTDLPQLAFVSCALQYGDENELPVQWNSAAPVAILLGSGANSFPPLPPPDTRTRDGFRLRWFQEHPSNQLGSGQLRNTRHFDIAPLANWNPRAAFSLRTPYENVTDLAPQFYGAYTRDLFDGAVSWNDLMPVPRQGIQQGHPFGQPGESPGALVLFDLPRSETGVVSIAQFQHVKTSPFIWHPSYAIGNSLADPRLETRRDRTAPVARSSSEAANNGWNRFLIGYATGRTNGGQGNEQWAFYGRWSIGNLPEGDGSARNGDAVIHDLSFELNQTLWDDFFLSGGTPAGKQAFAVDPAGHPLPNGRLRLIRPAADTAKTTADLTDFHRSAGRLAIDGAFNVNSTRVDAWKAVLAATRGTGRGASLTMFPRLLEAPGGEWQPGSSPDGEEAWGGSRALDDGEIDRLARAIVVQVKTRGPFLSLADFVNRRLRDDETGLAGTLEAAIRASGLNARFDEVHPLDRSALPDFAHPDNIADATRIDPQLMPPGKCWGIPAYLTQADVLQPLGPILTARSDTFRIRGYGECRDKATGQVLARAWCEAVVQRLPEPLRPDAAGLNPEKPGTPGDFGRRFSLASFRWLHPDEV